jgi:putative flippase GtrA
MLAVVLVRILNFLHIPFKKVMSDQQFRYLACGGGMAVLDVLLFAFVHDIILHKQAIHLFGHSISPHLAAMWIPFPFGFMLSYYLSRFVVFYNTSLPHRVSLFRYILLVSFCFFLNTYLIGFFVDFLHFNYIYAKLLCTVSVALCSYIIQRFFAFKAH